MLEKPALLVIDFINDIAHVDGKIARSGKRMVEKKVIARANEAIFHAKKQRMPVLFIKVGFHPGYLECPKRSPMFAGAIEHGALLLGSWGTQFLNDLAVEKDDIVIVKPRVSSFYATSLEAYLKAQDIKKIIITGTATNMTVEHTARDAHDRDYAVTILKDACESASEEAHIAALNSLSRFATVATVQEFIQKG